MKTTTMVMLLAALALAGCAEMPAATSGQAVDNMIQLQVADKNVIYNPVEGIASGYYGFAGEQVMKAYEPKTSAGVGESIDKKVISLTD